MASSFLTPTRKTFSTPVAGTPPKNLASTKLASYKNQQLAPLLSGAPALSGAAIDTPSPVSSSIAAAAAQTKSLSPVQVKLSGTNQMVGEGNERLAAIQRANEARKAEAERRARAESAKKLGGQYSGGFKFKPGGGQISVRDTVRVGNAYLRKDAAHAFIQMSAAFKQATGHQLGITEGWRSYDEQVRLYNLYRQGRGNLAARPGTSTHGKGTAVDINGYGDPRGSAFQWLQKNAGNFGYKWTGGSFSQIEPWHWDFVG